LTDNQSAPGNLIYIEIHLAVLILENSEARCLPSHFFADLFRIAFANAEKNKQAHSDLAGNFTFDGYFSLGYSLD
jgi:hypothetical protein